tara:strand:+ start:350 stop:973 length:624 start_codon:yes stop_codon:yes gene_type:complete
MLFRVIQSKNRGLITKKGDLTFHSQKPSKNELDAEKRTLFIWSHGSSRLVTRAWTKWTGDLIGRDYIYVVTKVKDIIDIQGQTKFHQWCSNKLRLELWEMNSENIVSVDIDCPKPKLVWEANRHLKNSKYLKKRNSYILDNLSRLSIKEKFELKEIYKERDLLNIHYGFCKYHVDHIIPLSKGGKHHPDNLQIILATQNLQKGSKIL